MRRYSTPFKHNTKTHIRTNFSRSLPLPGTRASRYSCYIVTQRQNDKDTFLMNKQVSKIQAMHMSKIRRNHPFLLLCWLGLGTLLLSACATQGDMMDSLNKTLRGYEKAVRWAKFDTVYSYHKWAADQEEQEPPDSMENIRVTKYEASRQKFDQKELVMKQTISLRYYTTDDPRERSLKHRHEWKYFSKSKRWYLISDPIVFP